jgi:hypothetical protein
MTDNLEDASNDPEVRYLIGEVFTHLPVDEVLICLTLAICKFLQTDNLHDFSCFFLVLSIPEYGFTSSLRTDVGMRLLV